MNTNINGDRYERERDFHNDVFRYSRRRWLRNYYVAAQAARDFYEGCIFRHCHGAEVLVYGCGLDNYAGMLAQQGAHVTAIDISDVAIRLATERARDLRLAVSYLVMNAEYSAFEDDSFDLICGSGILHHLDLRRAYSQIVRTLRPGGRAAFIEPLGHNPMLSLWRRLTPRYRTADEHALRFADLQLAQQYCERIDVAYFHLLTLLTVPFCHLRGAEGVVHRVSEADSFIFRNIRWARWLACMAVIQMCNPRKNPDATPPKAGPSLCGNCDQLGRTTQKAENTE